MLPFGFSHTLATVFNGVRFIVVGYKPAKFKKPKKRNDRVLLRSVTDRQLCNPALSAFVERALSLQIL